MKKLLKQLLAVTTAIMMAITLLPAMANAAEGSSEATTEVKTSTFTQNTGKFRILKTDKDKKGLSGAEFKYYKVYDINSTNGAISKNSKFASVPNLPGELSGNDEDLTWANTLKNYIATNNKNAANNKIEADGTLTTDENGYTNYVENASFGYYLIVETKAPTKQNNKTYVTGDPFFLALPGVVNGTWNYEVTSEPKVNEEGISGPEKKILTTDSNGEIKPVSANDVHVGDYIQYQIKVRVPQFTDKSFEVTDNMPKITITDTMSKNLTFVNDDSHPVTVTVNNQTKTTEQYNLTPGTKGSDNSYTAFTATLQADNGFTKADRGKDVIITYYARVDAVDNSIASDLQNSASVKVNDDSDIPGHHTDSYTYGIELTKTLAGKALEENQNVYFDLYEKKGETYTKVTDLENVVSDNKTQGEDETKKGQFVTTKGNPIRIKGLSLGKYALKETKTVGGYTLLTKYVEFNLVDKNSEGYLPDGLLDYTEGEKKGTNTTSNILSKTVDNKKGFSMPGTGGMGTYIFTIGGLVVMAGAVLLLVSSKKKRA
ncbi:MAG: SpaH/EbpB family LPXTG-anchored major pilin [Eubacterium sp.]|nr:SpaH/EbpB family LPXTG-anchored major pilin [Eubacterium sp.]